MAESRFSIGALLSEPMPYRRGLESKPSDYLGHGVWPTGSLRELTDSEKRDDWSEDVLDVAHFVKKLAMKLEERREKESIYKMANDASVNPQTLANFIRGETWGDVVVIFRLERGIREALWSHDHLPPSPRPCDHLASGHDWPDGELKPGTPPHVHFTKQLAVKLQEICDAETVARVADCADYDEEAIIEFLNGETWGDVEFILRLEHALNAKLWNHDHLSPQQANMISGSKRA